jgi:DNA replication and repair protein RecF
LMVIKEGPSERRRFIDITLCQLKPSYFYDLQQYNKVLRQRNTLLKNIQLKSSLNDTLEVWDNNLIKIGSKIVKARKEFIDKLNLIIEPTHYQLSDNTEKLFIRYMPSFDISEGNEKKNILDKDDITEISDIEKQFRKKLDYFHRKEIIRAVTLVGPQRDDYEIELDGTSIKMFGSQGQQRTAVLSIKLSEIEIMKVTTGECPVLLLDDVLSELDNKRREYLLNSLENIQTFITCTDKRLVSNKECSQSNKYYYVNNGRVKED